MREGVPALFMKFGFLKDTPEYQIAHDWRANRYHSPSNDLEQPGIFKEDAVKLGRLYRRDCGSRGQRTCATPVAAGQHIPPPVIKNAPERFCQDGLDA